MSMTQASPAWRTDTLIRATTELADIIDEESGLLGEMRTREVGAIQAKKTFVAATYEQAVSDLRRFPDPLQRLDHSRIAELRSAAVRLEKTATRNIVALHAATAANQRLAQAVAEAARKQHAPNGTYRPDGRLGASGNAAAPGPLSIDQTL